MASFHVFIPLLRLVFKSWIIPPHNFNFLIWRQPFYWPLILKDVKASCMFSQAVPPMPELFIYWFFLFPWFHCQDSFQDDLTNLFAFVLYLVTVLSLSIPWFQGNVIAVCTIEKDWKSSNWKIPAEVIHVREYDLLSGFGRMILKPILGCLRVKHFQVRVTVCETRALSTFAALKRNARISTFSGAGAWKCQSTFAKFYLRNGLCKGLCIYQGH